MKRVIALLLALPLTACTTAQREGARTGAAYGFLGSVTAAAVSTVLFGHGDWGNVVEAGVAGAAGGAAIGAASGAASEKQSKSAAGGIDVDKLRAKIGDVNFQAGVQLVQCKHKAAIETAERAFASSSKKDEKLYALLIQAAAAIESGQDDKAEALYPKMVTVDPKRTLDKVKADTMAAVLKVQQLRREQGLPACK